MRARFAVLLAASVLLVCLSGGPLYAQAAKQAAPPRPAGSPSEEMLMAWNSVGRKIVAMAEDFPEDKYDFKPQKDQKTFGEQLLHIVDDDYGLMSAIKGAKMGPAQELSTANYKTRAEIAALVKQAVADGAALITEQGHEGILREIKFPYGNRMVHAWFAWMAAIEHAGEHYGQLVVYYRASNMVPPESRPRR